MRLLIVEDDDMLRDVLQKRFIREGYAVDGCSNGVDGLDYALATPYDGIVLDVMLPQMDGISLLIALRARGCASGVLLLTARDAVEDRVRGLDAGADDYLVKPFKVDRVIQTLERARDRLLRRDARPVGAPVPAVPRAAEGRLMLRHREGVSFIDLQDILLVQREDRATVLYTADGGRYVTGDSLAEMEERLHSDAFFRCHKSYIINLNHIKDITPYGRWTYVVRLENTKHDALITHEKYEELERMFR